MTITYAPSTEAVVQTLPITQLRAAPAIERLRKVAESKPTSRVTQYHIILDVLQAGGSLKDLSSKLISADVAKEIIDFSQVVMRAHQVWEAEWTTVYSDTTPEKPFVHSSYEKSSEELAQACARLLVAKLTKEQIRLLEVRNRDNQHIPVNYGLMASIAMMCSLGKEPELDQLAVNAKKGYNYPLAEALVATHDLLEVSRADAMENLTWVMLHSQNPVLDVETVLNKLQTIIWVNEGVITELQNTLRTHSASQERLRKELDYFVGRIRQVPNAWLLQTVGDLTTAHVTGIARASGIETDVVSRKIRSKFSDMCKELNLTGDYFTLLPIAERALFLNKETELRQALVLRTKGVLEWDRTLREAIA